MLDLHEFLESNKKDIFDFIEYNQRSIPESDNIFKKLMDKLKKDCPMNHGNYDKTHYELAVAIVETVWIGCLSQMKENRSAYSEGTTANLKQVVIDAFDLGKNYAPEEEARRHQT